MIKGGGNLDVSPYSNIDAEATILLHMLRSRVEATILKKKKKKLSYLDARTKEEADMVASLLSKYEDDDAKLSLPLSIRDEETLPSQYTLLKQFFK